MDADSPRRENDLSEFERSLSGLQPGADGLDADAMLFAAGVAAGRGGRGRFVWHALCLLLVAVAAGFGAWGLTERSERLVLVNAVKERAPTPAPVPEIPAHVEPSYTPSSSDYLSLRQMLEQDPDRWPASRQPSPQGPPEPEPVIPTAGQRDRLLEQ
jgi:hypothetical protein